MAMLTAWLRFRHRRILDVVCFITMLEIHCVSSSTFAEWLAPLLSCGVVFCELRPLLTLKSPTGPGQDVFPSISPMPVNYGWNNCRISPFVNFTMILSGNSLASTTRIQSGAIYKSPRLMMSIPGCPQYWLCRMLALTVGPLHGWGRALVLFSIVLIILKRLS